MATPASESAPTRQPRHVAASAITLALIGGVMTTLLFVVAQFTRARIADNQKAWIKQPLYALLAPGSYDNDVMHDRVVMVSRDLLGTTQPATIYRVRSNGAPVAAVVQTIAPDGYRGPIELLVAIAHDGTLLGVQVIRHNETPGLGDAFEHRNADWLRAFRSLSLANPPQQRWTVRKDGGDFDAFTGATITPRAIVKAVRRALEFYRAQRERIFTAPSAS